jgi:hypothetical protein
MKKLLTLAFLLTTTSTLFGGCGASCYGKEVVDSIHMNGAITLNGTTVKGNVHVNGGLKAVEADIGSIHVNGGAELNHCVVRNDTHVNGGLTAISSELNTVSISTDTLKFDNCTIASILIRLVNSPKEQKVYLKNSTHVFGDIHFESGKGVLILSEDSTFTGILTGGVVKKS